MKNSKNFKQIPHQKILPKISKNIDKIIGSNDIPIGKYRKIYRAIVIGNLSYRADPYS